MLFHRRQLTSSIYTARQPNYEERRGERWLLVWRDIPHWTVVDSDLHELLLELDGRRSLDDVIKAHPKWANMQEDVLAAIATLKKSGVVVPVGDNRRIATPEQKPVPIENVALNITRRCNLRCKFCYNQGFPEPNPRDELSANEISAFLRGLKGMLGKRVTLTILGGEPLLRTDDLLSVCERAKRVGFDMLVSTNGTVVTEEFAGRAAATGLEVQVSLDGFSAELHDSVRGSGTFERTCEGIKTLVGCGVHTIVSMVCHRGNLPHLEKFYDLAISLGANEARFIPLKQIGGGVNGGFEPVGMVELIRAAYALFKRRPELLKLSGRDAFSIIASTMQILTSQEIVWHGSSDLSSGCRRLNLPMPEHQSAGIPDWKHPGCQLRFPTDVV